MRRIFFAASIGVFCLSTIAAGPMSLSPQSWALPVGNGGGFNATLDAQNIVIYCVDYRNHISLPDNYMVNDARPNNLSTTRYGNTAESAFSFHTAPNGMSLGDAKSRYLEVGWLITQYDANGGGARDVGIQNAIWTLLDVAGAIHNAGDQGTWLNNAATWRLTSTPGQIFDVESRIKIFSSTDIAGVGGDARYVTGRQEMINIEHAPEPSSVILLGTVMTIVGFVGRRKLRAKERP